MKVNSIILEFKILSHTKIQFNKNYKPFYEIRNLVHLKFLQNLVPTIIRLPVTNSNCSVIRSPFVYKSSREHFSITLYRYICYFSITWFWFNLLYIHVLIKAVKSRFTTNLTRSSYKIVFHAKNLKC